MTNDKLFGFSLKKRSFSDTKEIIISITYKIKLFLSYLLISENKVS